MSRLVFLTLILFSWCDIAFCADGARLQKLLKDGAVAMKNGEYLKAIKSYELYLNSQNTESHELALYQLGLARSNITNYHLRYRQCETLKNQEECNKELDQAFTTYAKNHPQAFELSSSDTYFYTGIDFDNLVKKYPKSAYAASAAYQTITNFLSHVDWGSDASYYIELIPTYKEYLKKYPNGPHTVDVLCETIETYNVVLNPTEDPDSQFIDIPSVAADATIFYHKALPQLLQALNTHDTVRKRKVAIAIASVSYLVKISPIPVKDLLYDLDPLISLSAATMILSSGQKDTEAILTLRKALKDEKTMSYAVKLIGQTAPNSEAAIPDLIALLSRGRDDAILKALGRFKNHSEEIIPVMINAIHNGGKVIAVEALGNFGDKAVSAGHKLSMLVADEHTYYMTTLLKALYSIGPSAVESIALPKIYAIANKKDSQIDTLYAAGLLVRMKSSNFLEFAPMFKSVFSTDDDDYYQKSLQAQAARVLGEIGPDAKGILPLLEARCAKQCQPCCEAASRINR